MTQISTAPGNFDDFADLTSLLVESVALREDKNLLKTARKTLKDNPNSLSGQEAQDLRDSVSRIEAAREWLPKAEVAFFSVQTCQCCGASSAVFAGFFQRQAHRSMRQLDRWVASPETGSSHLPKEIKNQEVGIPACAYCIVSLGFPEAQMTLDYSETPAMQIEALQLQVSEYEELMDELMTEAETKRHTEQQEAETATEEEAA